MESAIFGLSVGFRFSANSVFTRGKHSIFVISCTLMHHGATGFTVLGSQLSLQYIRAVESREGWYQLTILVIVLLDNCGYQLVTIIILLLYWLDRTPRKS